MKRKIYQVLVLGILLFLYSWSVLGLSAEAAVAPSLVGDTPADSIWVSFAVNDTLGNAAACDSAWVVQFYRGRAFDSTKLTGEYGSRDGLYAVALRASVGEDSVGAYWLQVRAYGVAGRNPHITYSYTVLDGGPVGQVMLRGLVTDSNLARFVTRTDYRLAAGDPWDELTALHNGPTTFGGFVNQTRMIVDSTQDTSRLRRLLTDQINIARDETKTDYQSTTGPGPTPVTLLVANATDTSSIEGVHLTVKLAADRTKKHEAITGPEGRASMTLNLVEYDIYATANNYTFSTPALNIAVSGDSLCDTVWAAAFDPGLPDEPELCRVYGWVFNLSGEELSDVTVSARLTTAPVRYQNIVISPYQKTTVSDTAGYWFLDVFPSPMLTPNSTQYELTIRYKTGAILRKKVTVPDSSSWRLSW